MVSRPLILVSTIISQSSKHPSYSGSRPSASPALLINTSISFHSAGKFSIHCVAFSRSRTSNANVITCVPFSASSLLISSRRCSLRPVSMRRSPLAANFLAQPSPIPLVAPVIKTILFILSMFNLFLITSTKIKLLV